MRDRTEQGLPVFRLPDDLISDDSPSGTSYSCAFVELGVEFRVVAIPRTQRMAGYYSTPCACWTYPHRPLDNEILAKEW